MIVYVEDKATRIGDKMAIFYESLCEYSAREHRKHSEISRSVILSALIASLCNLESHWPPDTNAGETDKASSIVDSIMSLIAK